MELAKRLWNWYREHSGRWQAIVGGIAVFLILGGIGGIVDAASSESTAVGGTPTTAGAQSPKAQQATSTPRPKGLIARADYGSDWPFTVDGGTLRCQKVGENAAAVTLTTSGTTYAINGIARAADRMNANGWQDGNQISTFTGSLNKVIADGLKLCQ